MMTARRDIQSEARVAQHWWVRLQSDAAAKAQLRRCHSTMDAATAISALTLARRLGAAGWDGSARFTQALQLARVLAWVKADGQLPLMRAIGWAVFPEEGETGASMPRLSESSFRRLIRIEDPEELADRLLRIIRLAPDGFSVQDLAADVLRWDEDVRRRWAYQYYAATIASPTHPISHDNEGTAE